MTYLNTKGNLPVDVAVHPYSDISGTAFVYITPSTLGEGVSRPTTTTFELASGRSYYLIGSIGLGSASSTVIDVEFQWYDVTNAQYVGKVGSARASRSNTVGMYRKNPMRRAEAVCFIPATYITGANITLRLDRTSISATAGVVHAVDPTVSEPSIVIMSVPD